MKKTRCWVLSALLSTSLAAVQTTAAQEVDIYDSGGPLTPEQAAFDVIYYGLDLRVDPGAQRIGGTATTVARATAPLRQLVLDLDTLLTIEEVRSSSGSDASLQWERVGGRIHIDLGSEYDVGREVGVTVHYEGAPRVAPRAPWDGGFVWTRTPSGEPWIATAVQGQGPDLWWPAKDHVSDKPDSMSIRIRVPDGLVVATNGELRDVHHHGDGTRTYDWFVSTPISAYNVALNIAPYVTIERSYTSITGEEFPVVFYALPEDEARGRVFMDEIIDHLRFFEDVAGPYPFRSDKYGVAQTPHLGMEHQTIIAYGARFNNGAMTGGLDWGFDALHHHELSHEWWGNLVTNADWRDMWLHEGFGTYMQALYAERIGGPELYRAYLARERQMISNRTPLAPRESRTSGEIYFDSGSDIYSKGAYFLHTLRWVLGDDSFFAALRRMAYPDAALERVTDGSHVRFATTDDFLRIAEETAGTDLDWLFEVYVRQPVLPRLAAERSGDTLRLEWDVPDGLPFPMPVEVEVDGRRQRVDVPAGGATIQVPAGASVEIDPDAWILTRN